ncbi:MAG: hypothetical protein QHH75_08205 [Bacillota bacterium]|nr:hypothetical protein [Bacillota bacterium]
MASTSALPNKALRGLLSGRARGAAEAGAALTKAGVNCLKACCLHQSRFFVVKEDSAEGRKILLL